MSFSVLMDFDNKAKEKYEYFLTLGYGEKAASVMAIADYGNVTTAAFFSLFPVENRLDMIYDWILENCKAESSLKGAMNSYVKDNIERLPEELKSWFAPNDMRRETGAAGMGFGGAMFSQPMSSGFMGGAMGMAGMGAAMMPSANMSMAAAASINAQADAMSVMMKQPMPAPAFRADPEKLAYDSYEMIEEKDAKSVLTAPTSTFRMTTSTASVGIMLNQSSNGRSIKMSQVRIEELLNYFDYDHSAKNKENKAKFKINTELLDKKDNRKLLYINVEADDTPKEHQNIILLLDTSGSMSSNDDVTFESMVTIISKLKEEDVLSLVTYSTEDHTVLTNHVVKGRGDKEDLVGQILGIWIEGCTNGSAGIETAYSLGEKTYKDGWSNQVILITDGDLNFGINTKDGLKTLIEEKKKTGMFLSVIGTGLYNYQDDKLEVLSKHGNGTYCVVNSLDDVKESINNKYVSLTNIVAKDVKAQVEFNPKYVRKYRLLGYENRTLSHEDFKNDKVISEPYGSGGHGVALYELFMGNAIEQPAEELKYQRMVPNEYEELGTVSVRFKAPLSDESEEISEIIPLNADATDNSRLAYFLYCLSEVLRGSDKLDSMDREFLIDMLTDEKYKSIVKTKIDVIANLASNIKPENVMEKSGQQPQDTNTDIINKPMFMNGMTMMEQMMKNSNNGGLFNNGMVDGSYMTYNGPVNSGSSSQHTQLNANNEWICPICGASKENKGKFCCSCGSKRPEDVWKCSCGHNNTSKFCNMCGAPKT